MAKARLLNLLLAFGGPESVLCGSVTLGKLLNLSWPWSPQVFNEAFSEG